VFLFVTVTVTVAALTALFIFWSYLAVTVIADIIYDDQRLNMEAPPFPGVADLLYMGVYAFAFTGLVLLTRKVSPKRNLEAGIDSAVIGLAVLVLVGFFVIAPLASASEKVDLALLAL
jgi:hypothetical protein